MPTFNQLIRHGKKEERRFFSDRTRVESSQKLGVGPRLSTRTQKSCICLFLFFGQQPSTSISKKVKVSPG